MRTAFVVETTDVSTIMVCLSDCAGRAENDGDYNRAIRIEEVIANLRNGMMPVVSLEGV